MSPSFTGGRSGVNEKGRPKDGQVDPGGVVNHESLPGHARAERASAAPAPSNKVGYRKQYRILIALCERTARYNNELYVYVLCCFFSQHKNKG